jgi:hypothetical protein
VEHDRSDPRAEGNERSKSSPSLTSTASKSKRSSPSLPSSSPGYSTLTEVEPILASDSNDDPLPPPSPQREAYGSSIKTNSGSMASGSPHLQTKKQIPKTGESGEEKEAEKLIPSPLPGSGLGNELGEGEDSGDSNELRKEKKKVSGGKERLLLAQESSEVTPHTSPKTQRRKKAAWGTIFCCMSPSGGAVVGGHDEDEDEQDHAPRPSSRNAPKAVSRGEGSSHGKKTKKAQEMNTSRGKGSMDDGGSSLDGSVGRSSAHGKKSTASTTATATGKTNKTKATGGGGSQHGLPQETARGAGAGSGKKHQPAGDSKPSWLN